MVSICTYLVAVHIEEGNMDRERAFVVTEKKDREAKRERERERAREIERVDVEVSVFSGRESIFAFGSHIKDKNRFENG